MSVYILSLSGVKSAPANPAGRGGADLKGRPKGARPGARRAPVTREVLSTPEGCLGRFGEVWEAPEGPSNRQRQADVEKD